MSRTGEIPASMEVEPVTRAGASLEAAQTIYTTPREDERPTVAAFTLKPGAAALKVTLRSAGGSVIDRWTQSLAVPNYAEAALRIGTARVFRTRTLAESRAFDSDRPGFRGCTTRGIGGCNIRAAPGRAVESCRSAPSSFISQGFATLPHASRMRRGPAAG